MLSVIFLLSAALATPVTTYGHAWGSGHPAVAAPIAALLADLDGDGLDDLVLDHRDRLDLFLGRPGLGLVTAPDATVTGLTSATSIAAGDFDGDGVADLAVGQRTARIGGSLAGTVHVLRGPFHGRRDLATATWVFTAAQAGQGFGAAVGFLPDQDGDGADELLVGAPDSQIRQYRDGAAYVVSSRVAPTGTHAVDAAFAVELVGRSLYALAGTSVAVAGDWDGDGRADLVVGVPTDPTAPRAQRHARVVVVPGVGDLRAAGWSHDLDAVGITIEDARDTTDFGARIAPGPDLDGDGLPELLVSAYEHPDGGAYLLYTGGLPRTPGSRVRLGRQGPGGYLDDRAVGGAGAAIAWLQDRDGDGLPELAVGAPAWPTRQVFARGRVHVGLSSRGALPGPGDVVDLSTWGTLEGVAGLGGVGSTLVTGDVDGDGVDELVMGVFVPGAGRAGALGF